MRRTRRTGRSGLAASRDLVAIARCAWLAAGWPSIFRFAYLEAPAIVEAFDRTVAVLIDRAIDDPARNREAGRVLLGTSLKVALAMSGFAAIAGVAFNPELAVLGSSFTRVYDDLIDNFADPTVDDRLDALFHGRPYPPGSDVEYLLVSLYHAIAAALTRPPEDPIFTLLAELHAFQRASRRQLDPRTPVAEVRRITRGKGGLGVTVLCALLKSDLSAAERAVLTELGDVLQLLDDHHDRVHDRTHGVLTEVTLGASTLTDVARRIRLLRRRLGEQYPGAPRRRLTGMLYLMLVGALVRRYTDGRGRAGRRVAAGLPAGRSPCPRPPAARPPAARRPVHLLLSRADNLHPAPPVAGPVGDVV